MIRSFWIGYWLIFSSLMLRAQPGLPERPVKPKQQIPSKPVGTTRSSVVAKQSATQTVKFVSDGKGELYIDGKKAGMLDQDIPLVIQLLKGAYVLKAVSSWDASLVIRETMELNAPGTEKIHMFSFRPLMNEGIQKSNDLLTEGNNAVGSRNFARARELYELAAAKGNARAMINLGILSENGNGMPKDYSVARQWYQRAAELQDPLAFNSIAYLYQNGYGVERDYATAMKWFRLSVDKGNIIALIAVGWLFEQGGYGVLKDYGQSMYWYKRAADQGHTEAMLKIGLLYVNGYGVPRDSNKAREWFRKSCEGGDQSGCSALNKIW